MIIDQLFTRPLFESQMDPITQFASNAHEEWRRNFDPTGTKPRIKKNSDGTEGDINVPFEKLHPDWKKENLAAGHAAHHAVKHFGQDMEKAAEYVHSEWMKRNPKADYNAAQHVPYDDLSDDEKEKDRVHVRTMMKLMGHHPKQDVAEAIQPGVDTVASVKKLWHYISRNLNDLASNASFEEEHSNQPYIEDRLANLLKTADGTPVTIAFDMGGNLEFNDNVLYVPVGNMWRYRGLILGADFVKRVVGFLSKQGVEEVAPPGARAERMVKHIKAGYARDGKLTPKEKGIAFATAWKAHNAGRVEEATGDERFDSMMGQIQREPRIPDSQMPPTDVKDLYHWAVKHHKPYHKIFAKWANREGFKSVAPALQKAGNLDSDAIDYWTPEAWKLWHGGELPQGYSRQRIPDELRDYLETVFDAYDRIVFDWPTEYRQISEQGVTEGRQIDEVFADQGSGSTDRDNEDYMKRRRAANKAAGRKESYVIVRTDAEGKRDVFAGNFDTYERAQKELDACLAHPLHTKHKQKFEIKRKGQQDVSESDTLMVKLKRALIKEGRVKELADDLKTMSDTDFMKKYGKSKAAIRKEMTRVDEAEGQTIYTAQEITDVLTGRKTQQQVDADRAQKAKVDDIAKKWQDAERNATRVDSQGRRIDKNGNLLPPPKAEPIPNAPLNPPPGTYKMLNYEGLNEEDAAGQQFVGTGTSSNWQMSVDIAAMNARKKAAQSIAGTNTAQGGQLPAGTKYGPQDTKSDGAGKYVSTYTITLPAPSQSAEPAPAAPGAALDSSPATSTMKGGMSTGAPAATGAAAGNYMKVNELSTNKLSQYKTAAALDAKKADQAGDFKRGDKRLSGMVQATKKQFDNDAKKVDESRAARRALMARIVNSR